MSRLKAIGLTALAYLVTGYSFDKLGLRVRILWLFRMLLHYEQMTYCDTWIWSNQYRIYSDSLDERVARVFVRTTNGFVIALRTNAIKEFASRLRQLAPQVQIRKLKDVNRSVNIGQ